MEEDVSLPGYNPMHTCPKCKKEYAIWSIRKSVLDGKPYLAHNFCPASAADGQVVEVCMDCKMNKFSVSEAWVAW